ncbi:unnamed protein product [Diplocarpon coronariae]
MQRQNLFRRGAILYEENAISQHRKRQFDGVWPYECYKLIRAATPLLIMGWFVVVTVTMKWTSAIGDFFLVEDGKVAALNSTWVEDASPGAKAALKIVINIL